MVKAKNMSSSQYLKTKKYRGFTRIEWFRPNVAWGTVYLTADEQYNRRIKLGFTQRKSTERRKELAREVDGRLLIVLTIKMPHAFALEAACHRTMRKIAKRDPKRTKEWYILRQGRTISDAEKLIVKQASRIQLIARLKFSWPKYGAVNIFKSNYQHAPREKDVIGKN